MHSLRKTSRLSVRRRENRPWALYVVLCLSLWRGPVPWFHDHPVDASTEVTTAGLCRHTVLFHATEADNQFGNWHLHFLLPWQFQETPESPVSPALSGDPLISITGDEPSTTIENAGLFSIQMYWDDASWFGRISPDPTLAHICLTPGQGDPALVESFSSQLLIDANLCSVTGVALC